MKRRYNKLNRSLGWRMFHGLTHFPRTLGRLLRLTFTRIAFHKDGRSRDWGPRLTGRSKGQSRESRVPAPSELRAVIRGKERPIKDAPRLWYYVGDTIDWLRAHSQLT